MKVDFYSKIILTFIAIFLGVIALKPLRPLPVSAAAPGIVGPAKFWQIQFSADGGLVTFFDQGTGELWRLNTGSTQFTYLGRVEAMGKFNKAR